MKILTLILTLAVTTTLNAAEVKSDEWKTNLESVIHQYDKAGTVVSENSTYDYRYHTLVYKFHPITSQIGDTTGETYNQEGPKEDGIFLQVSVRDGVYQDQVKIPQELRMPFWKTFVNAYPIDTSKYLWVSLSYGKTSDMKFVEALKTCFLTPKPRFGLYLVTKDAKDLDKIELASSPLITEDDIIDYNWTNHTMYITDTAVERISNKADLWGKQIVIVVEGKPVYRGEFDNPNVSISYSKPVIVFGISKLNAIIKTDRRKSNFDWRSPLEPDPRENESVKQVFRELGKLTEK
jgi:hypothetical protein